MSTGQREANNQTSASIFEILGFEFTQTLYVLCALAILLLSCVF
jgi:hypothetical protein